MKAEIIYEAMRRKEGKMPIYFRDNYFALTKQHKVFSDKLQLHPDNSNTAWFAERALWIASDLKPDLVLKKTYACAVQDIARRRNTRRERLAEDNVNVAVACVILDAWAIRGEEILGIPIFCPKCKNYIKICGSAYPIYAVKHFKKEHMAEFLTVKMRCIS